MTSQTAALVVHSRGLRVAAVLLTLLAGAMAAVQSQINGDLGHELGDGARAGFAAALISFGVGLAVLVGGTLFVPGLRRGVSRLASAVREHRLRPIELVGGCFGAFFVACQGLTVATIGVALFSVAFTAGQSASGLLVDHLGLSPNGHQPLSVPRLIATVFAIAAVVLATGERLIEQFDGQTAFFAVLPLLAGLGTGIQLALNGRINAQAGGWVATLVNFTVGTAALALVFGLSLLARGELGPMPDDWWLYTGGFIGVTFIWLAAVLVKVHGVLVLGLCIIAGQVIGAEAIEVASGDAHVGPVGIAAGALTVVGVLIALFVRPKVPVRS